MNKAGRNGRVGLMWLGSVDQRLFSFEVSLLVEAMKEGLRLLELKAMKVQRLRGKRKA